MTRIFLGLAVFDGLALTITFLVGVVSKWFDALHNPADPTFMIHFYLGLFSVIGNLAVHCLIFIYFLGTGRWVKEVALAFGMPDEPWPKLTRELKRRTFPPALFAMLVPIAAAASGTAAQRQEWPWEIHATLGVLTLIVNLWAFRIEYRNVRTNADIIEAVLREVDRIRAERGLPSNAEALRQQEQV